MSGIATGADFTYAPALESTAAIALRDRYGLFIGGEWLPPGEERTVATVNPATEEVLALVAQASVADVDRAVRAARRGYEKYWRKLRPAERAKYVYRIARVLGERAREFAVLETLDGGRPIAATRDVDVPQATAHFFYHAGWADKLAWALTGPERTRPLGVVGAIVASERSLLAAARKIAPALACGNTVVLKPSETTPLTALALAHVCVEADLPPGVINVITGDAATGSALVDHPDVDMIAFTGSAETGKTIRRAAAGTGKRVSLALGGTPTAIVYEDAPLDAAVEGIVAGGAVRVLVQEPVCSELTERLRARFDLLRPGDPLDRNTDLGPLPSRAARDRVAELVASGIDEGATLAQPDWTLPERGFWYPASLFANVAPTYRLAREELTGPLVAVSTFRTADEALDRANNLPSAHAVSVWTVSGALALFTAAGLAAGTVWCNSSERYDPSAPFGGVKESGWAREGGLSGLRAYLET